MTQSLRKDSLSGEEFQGSCFINLMCFLLTQFLCRYVFEDNQGSLDSELARKVEIFSLGLALKVGGNIDLQGKEHAEASHMILQYCPSDDFKNITINFSSKHIQRYVVKKKLEEDEQQFVEDMLKAKITEGR